MPPTPKNKGVVLGRVGLAYSTPGEEPLSQSDAFFKALADTFPKEKPPRFGRLGFAFALPEQWRAHEPSTPTEDGPRSLTEVTASSIAFRCGAICDPVERRYGNDAGTDTVMSALRHMMSDSGLDAFVVLAVDGPSSSTEQGAHDSVAAALLLTRAGTPKDEVRVIGMQEVQHWATPLLDRALSLAMGGALEKSDCTMADIERVVVSTSAALTSEAVDTAAQSLCAPSPWPGEVHTQEDFAGPLCAAAGAFDLAFEAMLLRYYAKHGQRFLWVSRTDNSTCVAVLRQDGGHDDDK